jgi:RNA-directed DNA polymerase
MVCLLKVESERNSSRLPINRGTSMLVRLLSFLFGLKKPQRETRPQAALRKADVPAAETGVPGEQIRLPEQQTKEDPGADPFSSASPDELYSLLKVKSGRKGPKAARNSIPREEDPRTRLIDQAMVHRGLISESELAEIYRIGRERTRFQNEPADAGDASELVVSESLEDQKLRIAQKKSAAAERRRLRAVDIRQRHATDIVFLGRGVSRGLSDRRSDFAKLERSDLPQLSSPADLAAAMEITISQLRWLAFHSDAPNRTHYVTFEVPKKNGGMRRLSAPHRLLAASQKWILTSILNSIPPHQNAHGFVTQHSVLTNAAPHVGSDFVINVDLEDFFPSITYHRVEGVFRQLGYSPAVATILGLLCTEAPRHRLKINETIYHAASGPRSLPQGACTSPAISNLVARRLDRRMEAMSDKLGWQYTRYADDITWSRKGDATPSVGYVLARIRHIVTDEGFRLNYSKTRIQRRSQRQVVTGIVVNDRTNISRSGMRQIRALLHNAQRTGLAAQNRNEHPHFESWLAGMIGWIQSVNPSEGLKLRRQFDQIRNRG